MGYFDDSLEHHGILGQKWGVRRFENKDGTLTAAGKARYDVQVAKNEYKYAKADLKLKKQNVKYKKQEYIAAKKALKNKNPDEQSEKNDSADKKKKVLAIGAAVVGTSLAAYGGYKLYQANRSSTGGTNKKNTVEAIQKLTAVTNNSVKAKNESANKAVDTAKAALKEFNNLQANYSKPTPSKPVQNVSQRTEQKLWAAQQTYNAGKTAVNTINKVAGQQKFSQASKANDDFVNELLKKNASMLTGF